MGIVDHPNVKKVLAEGEEEANVEVNESDRTIREKITHILSIYPKISVSMLQIGVGTSLMPSLWKPILNQMVKEGIIREVREMHMTPAGRQQSYVILSLV